MSIFEPTEQTIVESKTTTSFTLVAVEKRRGVWFQSARMPLTK